MHQTNMKEVKVIGQLDKKRIELCENCSGGKKWRTASDVKIDQ